MSRDKISREKAIEELQRLIREQRARIDPTILQDAARAAERKNNPSPQKKQEKSALSETALPYDRDAAAKSVELFLKNHKDKDGIRHKLMELLTKSKT